MQVYEKAELDFKKKKITRMQGEKTKKEVEVYNGYD
jgi:hypothetical protein